MAFRDWGWDSDQLWTFQRRAGQCGLNLSIALSDVTDSMTEAGEAVAKLDTDGSNGSFSALAWAWSRWWSIFLRQYGSRCLKRWRDKSGGWKDCRYVEQLWANGIAPLQLEGCNIAKQVRLRQVNESVAQLSRDPRIGPSERRELLEWAGRLEESLTKLIGSHVELQNQETARSLKDLADCTADSRLGRLKRSLFGKGQ